MKQVRHAPIAEETTMGDDNKAVVVRFNKEVIEAGQPAAFAELMAPGFVNRSAPPGTPAGPEGMQYFFEKLLRPALADLRVEIHQQLAEGDWVATRKTISGTHRGELMGVAATGKPVRIEVFDLVRVENGRYVEHWGQTSLAEALAQLRGGQGG
jgi:predicted ester cyclase